MAEASTSSTMEELLASAERLADLGSWELVLTTEAWRWSEGLYRQLGLDPATEPSWDAYLERVHPDDRERIDAIVGGAIRDPGGFPAEGVTAEFRVVRPDATVRTLRAIGRIEGDGDGARWFGVAQDITEQLLTERDLLAHYAVGQALREWQSFEEGAIGLLRRISTALDFPVAALWTWDAPSERIVCRALCSRPDFDPKGFAFATRNVSVRVGEGGPGWIWQTGEPLFVTDVSTDARFSRRESAVDIGLRSALGFAATHEGATLAVISLYGLDRREPSDRLRRTLRGIGRDLGRFLHGHRAQLEPSPLSPRELEVLRLAADGLSGPRIAERLVVSPSTVKTHFENIYEKLGVSDRAGAVAQALRTGLIS